jgi:hypothetical protein
LVGQSLWRGDEREKLSRQRGERGRHAMVGVFREILVNSELGTVAAAAVAR